MRYHLGITVVVMIKQKINFEPASIQILAAMMKMQHKIK